MRKPKKASAKQPRKSAGKTSGKAARKESVQDSQALIGELRAAAAAFSNSEDEAARVLRTMADDVHKALAQPLTIFPVIHHSPASAVHMVRWLRARQPKMVLIEMCEDLLPLVEELRDCVLPVALQAFSGDPIGFPPEWAPLSLVSPLTELSAEYQAIAYALTTKDVELVFVDRAVDHVFQWKDPAEDPSNQPTPGDDYDLDLEQEESQNLHGGALGIELGGVTPTFVEFRDFLLANARMSHFSEWMALYVEAPTIGADSHAYREVLFMIGSLFRRLGSRSHDRKEIRQRDRYMWTRIKQALQKSDVDPKDAVFLCGAAHIVDDDVPEWGVDNKTVWDGLPKKTDTSWQYGFIPSSYGAIEMQFGHPRGSLSHAESEWKKAIKRWKLTPYSLSKGGKKKGAKSKPAKKTRSTRKAAAPEQLSLHSVLHDAPPLTDADQNELIRWCSGIVALARDNRYLASTADAIAIYETSILLARMRARRRPSPYDFIDAAETCLEKMRVPGRRNVRSLCHRLLGGDRVGQVGYSSLPPLAQDIYDRLAIIGVTPKTRTMTRVLMNFEQRPEMRRVSKVLWRLNWMLPHSRVARPIMGELALGIEPRQESWDVRLSGAEQSAMIQLSFEGISIEQVLEGRLHKRAFGATAKTLDALGAAKACLLLLDRTRLFHTLGERAIELLKVELGPEDAAAIFGQIRALVFHFRGTTTGLPDWLKRFVATGYAHYATLLPVAFADRGTSPAQLGAMLSFVFTLESLALSMGCERSQLLIAIERSASLTADPEKTGLLWATEWLVQARGETGVRRAFSDILSNPLGRNAYPRYLAGFLQASAFAPRVAALSVDLLGRAFAELPDSVLLPWMPSLLATLQPLGPDVTRGLFRELSGCLPRTFEGLTEWDAPWMRPVDDTTSESSAMSAQSAPRSATENATHTLLRKYPAAANGQAVAFGVSPTWRTAGEADAPDVKAPGLPLLEAHPETANAWAKRLP